MEQSDQPPISQRRPKRRCSALFSPASAQNSVNTATCTTPSKRQSKRVRFSDSSLVTNRTASTGLTPFLGKASLIASRRRASTPASSRFLDLDDGEIQFTPFRQVLDDRIKRRLRRNGLSEEMIEYESERKTKAHLEKEIEEKDAELQRLREELEAARNTDTDVVASSQLVVNEIENELARLRESFSDHEAVQQDVDVDWEHIRHSTGPRSPGGDTIQIWEDDADTGAGLSEQQAAGAVDSELLAMAVDLEAARSEKDRLFGSSFRSQSSTSNSPELHFADSPAHKEMACPSRSIPAPLKDFYQNLSRSLKETTRRAEDAELAMHAFEVEIKGLGFEGETSSAMLNDIASQLRTARLELERLMPGETESGFESAKVLPEISKKLKLLVEQVKVRDAELKSMRTQWKTLEGNFQHALTAVEGSNRRVKNLEGVVDRAAEEMLEVRMRSQRLERDAEESKRTVDSLINAIEKYREDVERLEKLIEQMEQDHAANLQIAKESVSAEMEERVSDLDAQVMAEQTGRRAAETSAVERLTKIKNLELALSLAEEHSSTVDKQLTTLQTEAEQHSNQCDLELAGLNTRISLLSTALASSDAEVSKLKIQKAALEKRIEVETAEAEAAAEKMQANFIKGVVKANEYKNKYLRGAKIRGANWELQNDDDGSSSVTGPMTPASIVRFVDVDMDDDHVEGSVEVERGRRSGGKGKGRGGRRRYDSGIGMESLSEEDESGQMGLMTPEFSSDADYGVVE